VPNRVHCFPMLESATRTNGKLPTAINIYDSKVRSLCQCRFEEQLILTRHYNHRHGQDKRVDRTERVNEPSRDTMAVRVLYFHKKIGVTMLITELAISLMIDLFADLCHSLRD